MSSSRNPLANAPLGPRRRGNDNRQQANMNAAPNQPRGFGYNNNMNHGQAQFQRYDDGGQHHRGTQQYLYGDQVTTNAGRQQEQQLVRQMGTGLIGSKYSGQGPSSMQHPAFSQRGDPSHAQHVTQFHELSPALLPSISHSPSFTSADTESLGPLTTFSSELPTADDSSFATTTPAPSEYSQGDFNIPEAADKPARTSRSDPRFFSQMGKIAFQNSAE
ncbi:hypothetical protein N431DRAFT_456454 [Stipitochalara longipes BDJ]|nr:hypothetical protein N431DRAFT_456454 [Stipitochalara longipes BDJ]